ncbi:MAG TPA: hypothetical protein VGB26_13360 [Nitrospiria bacterium]|jgi:D-alanine-D-alanine ligase
MKKKLKVLVLFDISCHPPKDLDFSGELDSDERITENDVIDALNRLGHEVRVLGVFDDPGLIVDEIKSHPPDVVFNLPEQFNNKSAYERNVASLLQMLDIPYTGSGPTGLTLCKNKGMSKEILAYHRIDFPDFMIYPRGTAIKRSKNLGFPLFIKPLQEEGSYGISQGSFVENDQAFEDRIRFIHEKMDQEAMAEEFIDGRELYVSILGNQRLSVFPFREVVFSKMPDDRPQFSTFKAKWDEDYRERWGIQNIFAKTLSNGLPEKIARICKKVYRVLRIKGYGRIDLRLTPEGRVVILEANPNPGLAAQEEFAMSAQKAGISFDELIQRILNLAFKN